jgi:hypothetical protein
MTSLTRHFERRLPLLLAAICAIALFAALWTTRTIDPLRADSPSYLSFDPSRTVGYPAFLWLIRAVTGEVALAVPAQMALLAVSLFLLGWSFHAFARRPAGSLVVQALLVGSPEMWRLSAALLPEALATASVALWCSQMLRMLKTPSLAGIRLLVVIAGLGMTVRPSLLALFAGTAAAAFLLGPLRHRLWAFATIFAGFAIAWGATPAAAWLVHGSAATTSPVARGVLQHSLLCPPGHPASGADAEFVERQSAPVRAYIATAPADLQPILTRYYSGELRFSLIIPAVGRRHGLDAGWQTDPILLGIAGQRLAGNPLCYGASVAAAYYRIATYRPFVTPAQARRFHAFVTLHPLVRVPVAPPLPADLSAEAAAARELHQPLDDESQWPPRIVRLQKTSPLAALLAARAVYAAAALAGLLAVLVLLLRPALPAKRRAIVLAIAALGIAFHGVVAVTALVELGLTRYTVPLWPIVCTLLALVAVVTTGSGRRLPPPG